VVAILVALVLIALVVTAVICMLRKPAMPAQGNARAGTACVVMTGSGSTDKDDHPPHTLTCCHPETPAEDAEKRNHPQITQIAQIKVTR